MYGEVRAKYKAEGAFKHIEDKVKRSVPPKLEAAVTADWLVLRDAHQILFFDPNASDPGKPWFWRQRRILAQGQGYFLLPELIFWLLVLWLLYSLYARFF
jgi:hypothetical protein